jgi:phosphate transport system permease protein
MTDTTQSPSGVPDEGISEKVKRTLKKRYNAERRFKAYGLIAIGLALSFLLYLFTDIVSKGITAFWQSEIRLEVTFDPAVVDPRGDGSLDSINAGDFRSLVQDAFRDKFPYVSGRTDRRELVGLLSGGAQFNLRDYVLENPDVVGTTENVLVTLSDDADVFVKGRSTDISTRSVDGIASPTGTEGEIQILSTSNDFTEILVEVKELLRDQASDLDRDARRQTLVIEQLERIIGAGDGDIEQATRDLEVANLRRSDLMARAEALRARADASGGEEALSRDLPSYLIEINGGVVKIDAVGNSDVRGTVLVPLQSQDDARPGSWELVIFETPEAQRRMTDKAITWMREMQAQDRVELNFNTTLFTAGDSREPEQAGIWGAVVGSFFTLAITLLLSFPIGVMTAVYLEEFAPKNRLTDLIEVNINNLAAVPSIVFGLLGLAMFLNFFGLPRSAPLVGGMVLTLMTLPTIIIASRAALKAVPPSIREAALGMGASRLQAMTHHILPLAMPGMLTGTIIGMAQALGETAPLLMIGMVAFIVDIPGGVTDPATVLPVQIFLWADSPERAFVERTSAAIMVLLAFLISMNLLAVVLRKRFERRW